MSENKSTTEPLFSPDFEATQKALRVAYELQERIKAAAPDMLEVLERCAELLDDYSDVNDGDDGQPRSNRAMSLLQDVEAVIAKACGR